MMAMRQRMTKRQLEAYNKIWGGGDMMTLSEQMIRYRAKNKLTQKDFAEKVGVSVQTICSVETGQQSPSSTTRAKIEMVMEEEAE